MTAPEPPESPPSTPIPAAASTAPAGAYAFDLDAGRACLDFANTLRSSGELLTTYADLVAFATQSGLITPADADGLHAQASCEPDAARAVLQRAHQLRVALQSIFAALAAADRPAERHLSTLNAELAVGLSHACVLSPSGDDYRWGWSDCALDAPIWPIARSAADVLVSEHERVLVRECGAGGCAWLFLDTSKNRSRQWCSMQTCGNREKARRHYQRRRATRDQKP